ncbi:MAG: HAD-IIIA family hydrolase [Acidobacteriota bacterium]
MRRAVFLDQDGTVVREVGPISDASALRLHRGAAGALRALQDAGYALVMITNQSAVARGLLTEAGLARIHDLLAARLWRRGVALDGIYVCPHHPTAGIGPFRKRCRCRKPGAGLVLRACRELSIDAARSFFVGDSVRDVGAALRSGTRPILVLTGYGREHREAARALAPDLPVARDIGAAARLILRGGRA